MGIMLEGEEGTQLYGSSKRLSNKAAASEAQRRTLWGARCDE